MSEKKARKYEGQKVVVLCDTLGLPGGLSAERGDVFDPYDAKLDDSQVDRILRLDSARLATQFEHGMPKVDVQRLQRPSNLSESERLAHVEKERNELREKVGQLESDLERAKGSFPPVPSENPLNSDQVLGLMREKDERIAALETTVEQYKAQIARNRSRG